MARSRKNKFNLNREIRGRFYYLFRNGSDSKKNGFIATKSTRDKYLKECLKYSKFIKKQCMSSNCPVPKSIKDSRQFADAYIKELQSSGMSASYIRTVGCSLAKMYDCKSTDFNVVYEKRITSEFTRSREVAERDRNFSVKNNAELIEFQSMCGLRRKELTGLKSEYMFEKNNRLYIKLPGSICKHGKPRTLEVATATESEKIFFKDYIKNMNGKNKIHSCFDVHHYRSVYAERLYALKERNLDSLDSTEKYYCRGSRKGEVYDKMALSEVSSSLGHNRLDVVVRNYFYLK